MAISVADNFSYKGGKPLDARFQYATVADMKNATVSDLYDGCLGYVKATKKYYTFDSTNTTDPDTGKWAELETGGGGGTTYTAGDGIVIEEDEISTDNATSEDMDEIVSPLPSVMSRRFKYSTEEQVVGEWINGKPLYQKTISVASTSITWGTIYTIEDGSNINILHAKFYYGTGGVEWIPMNYANGDDVLILAIDANEIIMNGRGFTFGANNPVEMTIQYTKTTD